MQLKIKKNFSYQGEKLKEGQVVEIQDNDGVPVDLFWRNRLRDLPIDNAIEIVKTTNKNKE